MSTNIFLSKSEKLAKALSDKYNIIVQLTNEVSRTDGEILYLNLYLSNYEFDDCIKDYFEGLLDHEISHMIYSEFINSNAKKVLTNKKAIKILKDEKYKWTINSFEDIRSNRLISNKYPGCRKNINNMIKFYCEKIYLKNLVVTGLLKFKLYDRIVLYIRLNEEKLDVLLLNEMFEKDKIVIDIYKKLYIPKYKKMFNDSVSTTDVIFFSKKFVDNFSSDIEKMLDEKESEEKVSKDSKCNKDMDELNDCDDIPLKELCDLEKLEKENINNKVKKEIGNDDNFWEAGKKAKDEDLIIDLSNDKELKKFFDNNNVGICKKEMNNKYNEDILKMNIEKELSVFINFFMHRIFSKSETFEYESLRGRKLNKKKIMRSFFIPDYDIKYPKINVTTKESKDIAISFLIDVSRSMIGNKINKAQNFIYIITEVMKKLNIPFEVSSHNSPGPFHLNGSSGRIKSYRLYILKSFNDTGSICNTSLLNLMCGGNNCDGAVMQVIADRLYFRNEKRKIFFFLSDGLPSGYSTTERGINHMQYVYKAIKKCNIDFVGVGMGIELTKIFGVEDSFYFENKITNESIVEKLTKILVSKI